MQRLHQLSIFGLVFCLQACGSVMSPLGSAPTLAPLPLATATLTTPARPAPSTPTPMQKDRVRSIDRSEFAGFAQGQRFITMTSIWQNGSIPGQDGWLDDTFYVYAERPWDDAPPNLEAMSREWYEYLTT